MSDMKITDGMECGVRIDHRDDGRIVLGRVHWVDDELGWYFEIWDRPFTPGDWQGVCVICEEDIVPKERVNFWYDGVEVRPL